MLSMAVTFFGVRGSTPFSARSHCGFGGNTCCVVVDVEGEPPIILDMGSGLFGFAKSINDQPTHARVLLSHLHWDHVAGLPFFGPIIKPGGSLEVYGPPDEGMTLEQALGRLMQPPFFPITLDDFCGEIKVHDFWGDDMMLGPVKVTARPVPHTSATNGYRIEAGDKTLVYVPDHQQPIDDPSVVSEAVLELCEGADMLIHDGQYPPAMFDERAHWGHSTPGYAVEVARQAGVRTLAIFSHDPSHDDDELAAMETCAQELGRTAGLERVFSAREGVRVEVN